MCRKLNAQPVLIDKRNYKFAIDLHGSQQFFSQTFGAKLLYELFSLNI